MAPAHALAGPYADPMRILYLATSGSADATRASIPWHLAVNGSAATGQEVSVVLAGDATDLLQPDRLEAAEGVGLPPLRDLVAKAREHHLAVYV